MPYMTFSRILLPGAAQSDGSNVLDHVACGRRRVGIVPDHEVAQLQAAAGLAPLATLPKDVLKEVVKLPDREIIRLHRDSRDSHYTAQVGFVLCCTFAHTVMRLVGILI